MAGKTKNKVDIDLGCGFMGRILQLKSNNRLRKSSVHSLPMKAGISKNPQQSNQGKTESKKPPNHVSKIPSPRNSFTTETLHTLKEDQKPARKSTSGHRASSAHRNNQNRRPSDAARSSTSSSSGNPSHAKVQHNHDSSDESNKQHREATGNSLELARISTSHHKDNVSKSPAKDLSPLKLTGNLLVNNSPRTSITKSMECVPKNKELNTMSSSYNNANKGVMGNIMRRNTDELAQFRSPRSRVDPEVLKGMGNEAYKQGRFEEALALYDRAIALDSNKATYHCNKSAALIALGRLVDAFVQCEEAIRLEPSYGRAHNRLATIYFRYSIITIMMIIRFWVMMWCLFCFYYFFLIELRILV